jgi:hypothetical protein
MFNPVIRGWLNYYGRYYKSALYPTLRHLNRCLARWAMAKYKLLRRHRRQAESREHFGNANRAQAPLSALCHVLTLYHD